MVDVQNITSSIPRSNFPEVELNVLADLILETGGLLKPLILKKTGFEQYEVIDGHYEYYASVRACEKNPRVGEMVNALIISPENEEMVVEQVETLKGLFSPNQQSKSSNGTINFDSRITNIELRIERQSNELRAEFQREIQKLDSKFKHFESHITQRVEPLDLLNRLEQDELAVKLERSRITGAEKIAKSILDARHRKKGRKFDDYRDVVKSVKGLGDKTILTIIDTWSRS
jgi:hypothetical protein